MVGSLGSSGEAIADLGLADAGGVFSAFGAVKDYPDCEVFAEFLEAVGDAGADEEGVAGAALEAAVAEHERAASAGDDVDLVLGVGLLAVDLTGGVEADGHRAVAQHFAVLACVAAPLVIGHLRPPFALARHCPAIVGAAGVSIPLWLRDCWRGRGFWI